jgi:hypothetical protein
MEKGWLVQKKMGKYLGRTLTPGSHREGLRAKSVDTMAGASYNALLGIHRISAGPENAVGNLVWQGFLEYLNQQSTQR